MGDKALFAVSPDKSLCKT